MWKRKNKKALKKELFLNYTIMLLPHSQDKPVHFKIPVWVFLAAFLSLFSLCGMTLFFSYSSYRLKGVAEQKKILEQELSGLTAEKSRLAEEKENLVNSNLKIAQENAALEQKQDEQEHELEKLQELSAQTLKELEELYQREQDIRDELGLEAVEPHETEDGPEETQESEEQEDPSVSPPTEGVSLSGQTGIVPAAVQLPFFDAPVVTAQGVEERFLLLKNGIERQENSYDSMKTEIDEKAAEKRNEKLRQQIVSYALQFVGNRYVYGGSDPHTGVDCSGFSRYVLSHVAGVYLNRTASEQSRQGRSVSIDAARPGDLIFYGAGDRVNHVAIYIGDGKVVHASNERTGIIVSTWNYRDPVAIKNMMN